MGDFNAAKLLGDDCFLLLQERNGLLQKTPNDSGVARLSAASRRKLNALGSMIDRLEGSINEGEVCVSTPTALCSPLRRTAPPAPRRMRCLYPSFMPS
jgi:hypothetical protein